MNDRVKAWLGSLIAFVGIWLDAIFHSIDPSNLIPMAAVLGFVGGMVFVHFTK